MSARIIIVILLFLLAFLNGFSAQAKKKIVSTGNSQYLQIPLLYMTDRAITNNGYTNQRKYEEGSIYNVYCGSLQYTLENSDDKNLTPAREHMGWHNADKPAKRHSLIVKSLPGSGTSMAYDKFGQAIVDTVKRTGAKEVFIFLHGFNNPFAASASKAAMLAYSVECPVVLYSWPSVGKILQYPVDECNNEWSQEHFNRLIEELLDLKEKYGLKFDLVGHSMGNRLAIRSAQMVRGKHLFEQVFLVDPDLDAETFVHYVARYTIGGKQTGGSPADLLMDYATDKALRNHAKLRILFSRRDNALPITQLLFGGYTRLGQGADSMMESFFCPDTFTNALQNATDFIQANNPFNPNQNQKNQGAPISLSPEGTGTEGPNSEGLDNNKESIAFKRAFEWVDYTILDHGILGHTLPFSLVANLWADDKPGKDLAIIETENDGVNRFTSIASRLFKEGRRISAMGSCKKVVFEKDLPKKVSLQENVQTAQTDTATSQ